MEKVSNNYKITNSYIISTQTPNNIFRYKIKDHINYTCDIQDVRRYDITSIKINLITKRPSFLYLYSDGKILCETISHSNKISFNFKEMLNTGFLPISLAPYSNFEVILITEDLKPEIKIDKILRNTECYNANLKILLNNTETIFIQDGMCWKE